MSQKSIYLRDQAKKCEVHAKNIADTETQEALRRLAAEYVERATAIENQEREPLL